MVRRTQEKSLPFMARENTGGKILKIEVGPTGRKRLDSEGKNSLWLANTKHSSTSDMG